MPSHNRRIAVVGLGYVGLPVATAFARSGVPVIGFDIDRKRVDELRAGHDRTLEVASADLSQANLKFEYDSARLAEADFYIVTVPTPIDSARRPDLGAVLAASATVGQVLKRGDIVVYEFDGLSRHDRRGMSACAGEKVRPCRWSRFHGWLFA